MASRVYERLVVCLKRRAKEGVVVSVMLLLARDFKSR